MSGNAISLDTPKLRLRGWRDGDLNAFAALNSDPEVMKDLGGPIDRSASDRKFTRFAETLEKYGFGRWVIENHEQHFLGYAGVLQCRNGHPLAPSHEIGWRLIRSAWGQGYATEAARVALEDIFTRVGLSEVLAYTAPDNLRSQAVMERLKLQRDPALDFTSQEDGVGEWCGLVWVARKGQWKR